MDSTLSLTLFFEFSEETPDTPELVEGCPKQGETKDSQTVEVAITELSAVDLLKLRQEKIEAKKALISELVSSVLEDTQANVS